MDRGYEAQERTKVTRLSGGDPTLQELVGMVRVVREEGAKNAAALAALLERLTGTAPPLVDEDVPTAHQDSPLLAALYGEANHLQGQGRRVSELLVVLAAAVGFPSNAGRGVR